MIKKSIFPLAKAGMLFSVIFLSSCVGSQIYNPSLMTPGKDLEPGAVKIIASGGPAPYTHRDTLSQFSNSGYSVVTGEPVTQRFGYIGDITAQVGLKNNQMLSLRTWAELEFPLNRWGAALGYNYWLVHSNGKIGAWDIGIQPTVAMVGDVYATQGWGVQLAGVARRAINEKLSSYGGFAPFYGRIPALPSSMLELAEVQGIRNPRPDGFGAGLHFGFEYEFFPRLTGRIDINLMVQQDLFYRELVALPCFTLGFGYQILN